MPRYQLRVKDPENEIHTGRATLLASGIARVRSIMFSRSMQLCSNALKRMPYLGFHDFDMLECEIGEAIESVDDATLVS